MEKDINVFVNLTKDMISGIMIFIGDTNVKNVMVRVNIRTVKAGVNNEN